MIDQYLIDRKRFLDKVCPAINILSKLMIPDPQFVDYYTNAIRVCQNYFYKI